MTRRVLLSGLFCAALGACFDPELVRCLPCADSCPSGERCIGGMCQVQAGECKLAANTTLCGDECCIDGACFDLKGHMPPDSLALWLDWTSLYESESQPIWRDRSANANAFMSDGRRPVVESSPEHNANVLRLKMRGQYLVPDEIERYALADHDFLLLAAGSVSCETSDPKAKQCLVTRVDDRRGVRLCAALDPTERSQLFVKCASEKQHEMPVECVSGLVNGVPCGQMQLLGLRRFAARAADGGEEVSNVELRHNGVVQDTVGLDPAIDLDASSLQIGAQASRPLTFGLMGDIALVALFIGKVSEQQTCELERYILERLNAANMHTGASLPECSRR